LTEDEGQDIGHLLVKLLAGRADPVAGLLLDAQ
jgi:hypothetical protein